MTNLPTGTVTFLFTDIQGSTRLTQELGDAWPPLLERHRQIARSAWAAHQGVEVGTEGDSFFVAFTSALQAIAAAAATQRGIAAEPWPPGGEIRLRMGTHTGEGLVRGGGYVGLDVHRAARIANAGHGGQVLVSATTHALVEGSLPDGLTLRELGEHRLKDLSRPERIWDLVIDGVSSDFPPLRTLDAVPNNLPTQLTTFLGRQRELAEAAALLDGARLLTLTGPGGTGKTRLALQLAADATERFHDGVYFVPLGTIGEPDLVLPTIAQALGMPDPGGGAFDRLADQLAGKELLLVLDNFEQVIDAASQIGELLTRLPDARVLATSRSPLRVYGEQEYPVPPLALPDPRHLPDLETLSQFASVALFVERAMAVRPGFTVEPSNAAAIAEICVRLDGLPLAIELAAARVRVLSPPAILSRLGDRLSLLAGGSTNLPERQRTLRGAIAWSHELLEPGDRVAFARLSAFAGGWDLAAVESVALPDWPAHAGPPPDPLDAVGSLLDKSLLRQALSSTDEPRFQMLESIRAYAIERLNELEPGAETRRRHADYYLRLAEAQSGQVFGGDQRAALDTLEREHDNLRSAITFAIAQGDVGRAMRLLAATWRFWQMRGYLPEARDKAERILAMPGGPPEDRLKALDAAGGIAYWQGDVLPSRAWYQQEATLAAELGDEPGLAEAMYNESFTYSLDPATADQQRGRELAQAALDRFRSLGDRHGEGKALWGVVNSYVFSDSRGPAAALVEESIAIARELDDRFQLGWALFTRGLIAMQVADHDLARASYEEAIKIFRETDDLTGYV
ncbi:MAG TPA: adenylate/guanylate cyclase domain-containing protein, partial [Candidatus Limnocylindrales bacterium]|nr:adenylate/guanylate cyclase domain-containing protein [Candidatus Limnocylindrales bacterium]